MCDVHRVVGVEADLDAGQSGTDPLDQVRQPPHVGIRAWHGQRGQRCRGTALLRARQQQAGQIAEVVLRVDDQEAGG